jgi:hypothetical protein
MTSGLGGTSTNKWTRLLIKQYDKTWHPLKFSYIRMNIRNFSFSSMPKAYRRSTTREIQW